MKINVDDILHCQQRFPEYSKFFTENNDRGYKSSVYKFNNLVFSFPRSHLMSFHYTSSHRRGGRREGPPERDVPQFPSNPPSFVLVVFPVSGVRSVSNDSDVGTTINEY